MGGKRLGSDSETMGEVTYFLIGGNQNKRRIKHQCECVNVSAYEKSDLLFLIYLLTYCKNFTITDS